jgi:Flp pilus assembly protein TadD
MSFIRRNLLSVALSSFFVTAPLFAAQEAPEYAQAEAFVRQGQWDSGIGVLEEILQVEPGSLKARNLLGIALTGKGELVDGNRQFQRALQISPKFYPALKNLAVNEVTLKDFAAAERHLNAAAELAPDDTVIQAYLGELAYGRHDYKKAASHLSRAGSLLGRPGVAIHLAESYLETEQQESALATLQTLDKTALPAKAQFSLGLALAQHSLQEQAITYFDLARRSYPDSYDLGFDLALCYVETKQYPQAVAVLRDLSERGHKTAELDNLLAEAYEGNQQINEAIRALREATLLAPEDENNYIDLATLCIDHDAYDLGLQVLNVGLHYRPQSDRLVFERGILHAMQNQFELADQDFELASKLAPEKNLSYIGLSVSYMQTGNLPEAIQVVRQRVKQKPDDYTLQYLLGQALIRSGVSPGDALFAEAKAAFQRSVKLSQTFAPSRVELGKLVLRQGYVNEAVKLLEQARELDPKDKAAYSQLAIAYRRQGKSEAATEMLSTLARLNDEDRVKESRDRVRLIRNNPLEKGQNP